MVIGAYHVITAFYHMVIKFKHRLYRRLAVIVADRYELTCRVSETRHYGALLPAVFCDVYALDIAVFFVELFYDVPGAVRRRVVHKYDLSFEAFLGADCLLDRPDYIAQRFFRSVTWNYE